MSRSNKSEERIVNPAKRFYEWDGKIGQFRYYDKSEGMKKNVYVDKLAGVVIEIMSTIKGFDSEAEQGIFSNEVKNLNREKFNVRAFRKNRPPKQLAYGYWADIKGDLHKMPGIEINFTSSVYFVSRDEVTKNYEIYNMQLQRSALSAWTNITFDPYSSVAFIVQSYEEGKKGSITFRKPVFEYKPISKDVEKEAEKLEEEVLMPYLMEYRARNQRPKDTEEEEKAIYPDKAKYDPKDDPFASSGQSNQQPDPENEPDQSVSRDDQDEIDDLPF